MREIDVDQLEKVMAEGVVLVDVREPMEFAEKGKRAGVGIGMFSVAGLMAFFGFGVLVTTFVLLLDLVLPAWAAALIVAVVLLAIAGVAAVLGKNKVAEVGSPAPERALSGIKQDLATVKGERP